ncbi:hypothetical protein BRD00_11230 [Halobacteriales archaeon QS_8_69_26]|nr:MAG: hypothetical protein BRD00_11230 [Halobacteriales archaeon QS_8_69_26]
MTDLSSCYFCGTAIEAPVREYPVVPEDLGDAEGPTVSLCPTCRRKHRAVVETVLATLEGEDPGDLAVAADSAGGTTGEAGDPSGGDGDASVDDGDAADRGDTSDGATTDRTPGSDGPSGAEATSGSDGPEGGPDAAGTGEAAGSDDAAGEAPGEAAGSENGTAEATGEGTGTTADEGSEPAADDEGSAEGEGSVADDEGSAEGEGSVTDDEGSAEGEGSVADDEGSTGGEGSVADDEGSEPAADDERSAEGEGSVTDDDPEPIFSTSTSAGEAADDDDDRVFSASTPVGGGAGEVDPEESVGEQALSEDDEEAVDAPDVDVSTPPHSKVVRQLQNREFPVDREEIVTVATGAYGLSRTDATAALDALVAQGILREEDGRLHRVEDRNRPGGR